MAFIVVALGITWYIHNISQSTVVTFPVQGKRRNLTFLYVPILSPIYNCPKCSLCRHLEPQ